VSDNAHVSSREWNVGVATGLLRVGVGTALLRWRGPLARRVGGAAPDDRVLPALFGYFGARDLCVGLLTLAATRPDGDVARQVGWQGIADATDAALVAAVAARGRISRGRAAGAIVLALGSAVAEFATVWDLHRRRNAAHG
jgi:hypothetical protein